MGFKQISSSDRWINFRNKNGKLFEPFIKNDLSEIKERDFENYLKTGFDDKFRKKITNLKDKEFIELEQIVNNWFSFQTDLIIFFNERIRRFNKFG